MVEKAYLFRVTYEIKRMMPRVGEKWRLHAIQVWVGENSPDEATRAAYDQLRRDGYNTRFVATVEFLGEEERISID